MEPERVLRCPFLWEVTSETYLLPMPGACLNPYGCEWDIAYLWRWMNWIGHADVYVLAVLLVHCVAVFFRAAWRYRLVRRAPEIDSSVRMKVIADLSTAVRGFRSLSFTAPYLGLAGTCFGIMGIFRGIGMEVHAVREMMTAILAAALITTAAGIVVAAIANCFCNDLCTRIDLLESEILNESLGCRFPLRKRFSGFPALALIVAPILAMAIAAFMSFASFREPKGLGIEVASARCEDGAVDRLIVLRITNGSKLFLNSEQQNWSTLTSRLAEIYAFRVHRILYLSADDGVPFQTVADAIDIAQNTRVGSGSLNITVRLVTPRALSARCPEPVRTSYTQHASP
jgi:biopolymer transport protein ExbD